MYVFKYLQTGGAGSHGDAPKAWLSTPIRCLLAALPLSLAAPTSSQTLTENGLTYSLDASMQSATLTRCDPALTGAVTVASLLTDDMGNIYNVWHVDQEAFADCSGLTSVDLNNVSTVEQSAFRGCSSLTSVEMNNVTNINGDAFKDCTSLTSITLPSGVNFLLSNTFSGCTSLSRIEVSSDNPYLESKDGVLYDRTKHSLVLCPPGLSGELDVASGTTKIDDSACRNCAKLTGVKLPVSLTEIAPSAFNSCTGLTGIALPSSVTKIGQGAFAWCSGLTAMALPTAVTDVAPGAFAHCCSLTDFTVAPDNAHYKSSDGMLLSQDGRTLVSYAAGRSGQATIPATVTIIAEEAFRGCKSLTFIRLPNSVTEVGDYAFADCSKLTYVRLPYTATAQRTGIFYDCRKLAGVTVTYTTEPTEAQKTSFVSSFGIPSAVPVTWQPANAENEPTADATSELLEYSYDEATHTAQVTGHTAELIGAIVVPATTSDSEGHEYTVTGLAAKCFEKQSQMTSLNMPSSLSVIGQSALEGCTGLTGATLPEGLTTLGTWSFRGCTGLTSVVVPRVARLGAGVFEKCSKLTSAALSEGLTLLPDDMFKDCRKLGTLTLPSTLRRIGSCSLQSCDELTELTLPAGVTSIGSRVFSFSKKLAKLTLPDGVATLEHGAFEGCPALEEVTLPYGISEVGYSLFVVTPALKKVVVTYHEEPTASEKSEYEKKLEVPAGVAVEWVAWQPSSLRRPGSTVAGVSVPQITYDLMGRRVCPGHRGLVVEDGRLRLRR